MARHFAHLLASAGLTTASLRNNSRRNQIVSAPIGIPSTADTVYAYLSSHGAPVAASPIRIARDTGLNYNTVRGVLSRDQRFKRVNNMRAWTVRRVEERGKIRRLLSLVVGARFDHILTF